MSDLPSISKEEISLAKEDAEAIEYQVVALTAAGKTTREVAKIVSWDQKRVVSFLGIPENMKKVTASKKALLEAVNGSLVHCGKKAAATLFQLMDDKDPSVALNAAKITFDNIIKISGVGTPQDRGSAAVALQVNIGSKEATKVVNSELRKYHNR